jgi:XTP/dITP diphosphohydrolase
MREKMPKILLASNNSGKLREASAILAPYGLEVISPKSLDIYLEVAETGNTYLENASLKAHAFWLAARVPCLADDSGLEVSALDGAPGVFSHRFTGSEQNTDAERCQFLIEKLRPFLPPWKAAFHCYMAFYDGAVMETSHGTCKGEISAEPKGNLGFGYDPIFKLEGYPLTMAEVGEGLKNSVSHRADALNKLLPFLKRYFRL